MAETGHGAQGHLPASPHQLTDAGATTLPISAVEIQGHLVQPGVAAEITYLPMTRRYLHLVTIMDPRKPYVLASRLSDTLEANSRIDAQRDAVNHGWPEVFNTRPRQGVHPDPSGPRGED